MNARRADRLGPCGRERERRRQSNARRPSGAGGRDGGRAPRGRPPAGAVRATAEGHVRGCGARDGDGVPRRRRAARRDRVGARREGAAGDPRVAPRRLRARAGDGGGGVRGRHAARARAPRPGPAAHPGDRCRPRPVPRRGGRRHRRRAPGADRQRPGRGGGSGDSVLRAREEVEGDRPLDSARPAGGSGRKPGRASECVPSARCCGTRGESAGCRGLQHSSGHDRRRAGAAGASECVPSARRSASGGRSPARRGHSRGRGATATTRSSPRPSTPAGPAIERRPRACSIARSCSTAGGRKPGPSAVACASSRAATPTPRPTCVVRSRAARTSTPATCWPPRSSSTAASSRRSLHGTRSASRR